MSLSFIINTLSQQMAEEFKKHLSPKIWDQVISPAESVAEDLPHLTTLDTFQEDLAEIGEKAMTI